LTLTLTLTLNLRPRRRRRRLRKNMNQKNQLNHEKLEVYQISIQFLALVSEILEKIPRGNGEIKDQLKRASLSITLNISEGYGKSHSNDRAKYYDISRGSAHESAAILDVCKVLTIIQNDDYCKGKNLLYRIVCMLVKLGQYQKLGQAATATARSKV
jgi:four helix bundle protein